MPCSVRNWLASDVVKFLQVMTNPVLILQSTLNMEHLIQSKVTVISEMPKTQCMNTVGVVLWWVWSYLSLLLDAHLGGSQRVVDIFHNLYLGIVVASTQRAQLQ
jgi:hypothetical protein